MLKEIKEKALKDRVPIIQDESLKVLLDLIENNNYQEILELGCAIGYSAINMALLNKDIHIDTIEKNEDMYNRALENIKNMNLDKQIDIHYMPIEEFDTDKIYDFIFVDAAKAQYSRYLEKFLKNLSDDGLMFFDNIAFHGLTNNPEVIKNRNTRSLVRKINQFKDLVSNDERFDIMIDESIGDGILILKRRKA